jgi:hypothetical protein
MMIITVMTIIIITKTGIMMTKIMWIVMIMIYNDNDNYDANVNDYKLQYWYQSNFNYVNNVKRS